jgi:3-oxo-4-pregnene-20-carboxyl-CoA dehydrogenase alpha subunit
VDFELDEEQRELRGLAAQVLDREATPERLAQRTGGYDAGIWKALAQAGLLGACLPAAAGGAGRGAVELAVVLREIGAHVPPVPAYASLALGAMTIAAHGTPAQQGELLTPLADGDAVLTGAVREPGTAGSGVRTMARRAAGGGYVLDGVKTFVPYAAEAYRILVPARLDGRTGDEGVGVFLVEPAAVRTSPHPAATGEPMARLALDGVRVGGDALLGEGAWTTLRRYASAGAVATVSGVVERALALTTEHVKTREQFGRVLAEFQAVTMRVGDVYIAKRALDVAMWAAVWRLDRWPRGTRDAGVPDAPDAHAPDADDADVDEALAVAAYNACGPAVEALYACQHLHGGIGMDVTYPLHRYFAWGKHYGHLLGGAEAQLDALGDLLTD